MNGDMAFIGTRSGLHAACVDRAFLSLDHVGSRGEKTWYQ